MLTTLENAHIKILLAGITLPPNYGPDYIQSFEQVFRDLAAKHHTAFVPMIYKDLVHVPGTIQPDGIHPTAKGSEIIAKTLLPALTPLLRKRQLRANQLASWLVFGQVAIVFSEDPRTLVQRQDAHIPHNSN